MGRRRTSNLGDPPRFHKKGRIWYHVSGTTPRIWTKLSDDRKEALRLWADLEGETPDDSLKTFEVVARRYVREVLPGKMRQTQIGNLKELEHLKAVFGHMPIDAITPQHVRQYLDVRGQVAKTRANREKALLSHVFNFAREKGYTSAPNPCAGVKGYRERGRDRYIEDAEFLAVWEKAHFTVQDAMDLALLTGQRPADVLKFKRADIREGALWIEQNKTRAKLRIIIEGRLADLIERINNRPRKATGLNLIQDENGQPLGQSSLRSRFNKARSLAGVSFQFRDIRAKAASDTGDLAHSQKLLSHKNRAMTERYVRARVGESVRPLK